MINDFDILLENILKGQPEAFEQWKKFKKSDFSFADIQQALTKIDAISPHDPRYANALTLRAYMHQHGQGGAIDFRQAIALYEQAIALSNSIAMVKRAYMHEQGQGGLVDYKQAIGLYDQAIALGNTNAMINRALMYLLGQGGRADVKQAIALFEQAIALGDTNAMGDRAYMYRYGQAGDIDLEQAITLYDRAIALGNSNAMYNRALMYEQGQGGDIDFEQAISLYDQAIALGNTNAMYNRALMYQLGQGCNVDFKQAIALYEQAIALGSSAAMHNRATMYRRGQGGDVDVNSACKLYYQAYCASKYSKTLESLELLAEQGYTAAQQNLILIYLKNKQISRAQAQYVGNTEQLMPLLYETLTNLVEQLPKERKLTQALIDLVSQHETALVPSLHFAYVKFKLHWYHNEGQQALALYRNVLYRYPEKITNHEWFLLGNAELGEMEGLSIASKIKRLKQACRFYAQGYQQGVNQCHQLLTKSLRTKDALEQDRLEPNTDALIDEEDMVNQELINRFLAKPQRQNDKEAIIALATFIATKKYQLEKRVEQRSWFAFLFRRNPSRKSLALAENILDKLKKQLPLSTIVAEPTCLKQLKKHGALYRLLKVSLQHEEKNPLNLLMDAQDCLAMLNQPNSGKLIYEALTTGKQPSNAGLAILARHKQQTKDYIQKLPKEEQAQALTQALDTPSLLYDFFRVQRGFFTPKRGRGTLKQLEAIRIEEPGKFCLPF